MNKDPLDRPPDGHSLALARAALPEILFPRDFALALRIDESVARVQAARGYFGPWFTVRGEPAVRREVFLETLDLRAGCKRADAKEVVDGH